MGSFFMSKILVNLFFRVTRMTDEDGRIESGRDVGLLESSLNAPFILKIITHPFYNEQS